MPVKLLCFVSLSRMRGGRKSIKFKQMTKSLKKASLNELYEMASLNNRLEKLISDYRHLESLTDYNIVKKANEQMQAKIEKEYEKREI